MASLFLSRLKADDRKVLLEKLHKAQSGNCFICEQAIDLVLHAESIDIDHVIPTAMNGKDDENNFAITHASCNRSKQAANLEVAKILNRFARLKTQLQSENRNPNLGDILKQAGGGCHKLHFNLGANEITFSFPELNDNAVYRVPVYTDDLSKFKFFFAKLPIHYLAHDAHINPRSIGANISKLVDEFHRNRPQLHVPLAWISSAENKSEIFVFDGQHKAAAQIMLGVKELPVRVFIDPDADVLITANTNAGTTLKQVAFDKSVQRNLGSTLYQDRISRYQKELGKQEDDFSFSERDLVNYFKGQSREIKRYVLDAVRNGVTHAPENQLREYIDLAGKAKERPLSYSTIEKTFYSFFIFQEVLESPLNYLMEEGENPRSVEREQIIRLMNVIAKVIYIDKFDPDVGTDQIESKLKKGEPFAHGHLCAYRMSKEEIIYNWLQYVAQIARQHFIMLGKPDPGARLFQHPFPDQVWVNIETFLKNLADLPLWVSTELSDTAFGGKQNSSFWKTIFETGRTPQGMQVLAKPLNLIDMIK